MATDEGELGDRANASRPAFYALASGGWRDYLTLLHLPYTTWHLSYICIGWAVSPQVYVERLISLLVAFFLAVGIGAHALDELNGRPLRTSIPSRVLAALAALSIAVALAVGIAESARTSWTLLVFVAFGAFIVVSYNLELFRGRFHSDVWFALAWGAFPAFVGAWWNIGGVTLSAVLVAAACFALSLAQRSLSTPVRALRRGTRRVDGVIERSDGSVLAITREDLRGPPERALKAMSFAVPLLAVALVALRL